ncbi:MAG: hypothetical protein A3I26_01760 [Candidatus Yanofskybacteria bacterium RIFCSPLOWO2_02_FULL_43_10]|uniref:DUF58 domain-containing protein n=1 Tax=Candidatus Yanofskybacteria bacterium RIFCSPLOWO2_12_FULL_43_11b TaxID=1802710 RepID=A0A1F8H8Q7_9BACT|nr:MAG: hypothetical protein A2742_02930 [Candidatus Yanofskybacteria bacterium RIFCSPHIGHO2_01_FULL_43_32]OGN17538.1 MAG: hypothetical protein A3E34_03170 [Candidatus Yanofskybacteria bacterium RIFCSPHIGHO2_12_FULL_43_11]OGN25109.1 MAG: hypothetical protein A2923_01885 [Candidatus Yanofskybacteria bacterium RIFCSPLOWO2_01_FULL_43_46]OGN29019.1 MAG: hypothetical protein A3I26_01760 [Candidatus Yanofskybacteria bacterium RIFCSPLOWO2_02_FULL_43_10]OGN33983.1 MAG: hypothetical protein A3G51_00640 
MKLFAFNEVLSALTHIRGGLPATRLSTRVRLAEHRSVFFGQGDFHDIQEYNPERDLPGQIIPYLVGPDDEIYSRKCVEHHEIKAVFLIDLSSSIDAGINFIKRRLLLETIGYIGLTGARYQDPIGLAGFTDRIVLNLPARCGQNNFTHLLRTVYSFLAERDPDDKKTSRQKTDFFSALDFIRRSFNQRCFIPVVSDFVGFEDVVSSSLLRAVASKHELVFVFLDDPQEFVSAGGIGYIRRQSIEGGRPRVVSRSKLAEDEQNIRAERTELRRELKGLKIQSVVVEYNKHFNRLFRFFEKRRKTRISRQ